MVVFQLVDAGDNYSYPPSLPLVDYYSGDGRSAAYDLGDSGSYNDGLEDSLPLPPTRGHAGPSVIPRAGVAKIVAASPQLQRRLCDQVTQLLLLFCCFSYS